MNQNLHISIIKLYKNELKSFVYSRKFYISYSALNLPEILWKMQKYKISLFRSQKLILRKKIVCFYKHKQLGNNTFYWGPIIF